VSFFPEAVPLVHSRVPNALGRQPSVQTACPDTLCLGRRVFVQKDLFRAKMGLALFALSEPFLPEG